MPLTYTHYRFGQRCLDKLPEDLKTIVKKNINYYNYGLQGPDIFYYYNLIKNNKIKEYGSKLHNERMKDTLILFKKNISKIKDRDAALSYILGYISHFLLDSYCYTYIEKASKENNILIETIYKEIDNYYYIKDKIDLNKFKIESIFKPSKKLTIMLLSLYDNFKESIYKKIIYDYKTKLYLLKMNSSYKIKILNYFATLINNKKMQKYLLEDKRKECFPFCVRCDKYFEIAAFHYPKLISNFINYLTKSQELCDYYNNTLKAKEKYNNIQILDIENELKYLIYSLQD